ncbi:MAG TPA: hypothetical protein VFN48_04175 [Solirubrobacteraceae bacterium]|nr:hypothetical protein [Solirubrobacteraceae bacterium]
MPQPDPFTEVLMSDHDLLQLEQLEQRRILSPRQLSHPLLWRRFWELLWDDVCSLRRRYGLPVRSRWWEDEVQVEALAALAAWSARFDSGDWEDPPGKLSLLFELERVAALLRDGHDPLDPRHDRALYERHLRGDDRGNGAGDSDGCGGTATVG